MDEIMLKVDNVSKVYKLGQIGGTTLRDELQRRRAKRRNEDDPTRRIGTQKYKDGELYSALDAVSFEVKKGERVGIIGYNGAGKSTLLKLISRITAPTSGYIGLNGRVASMLEVGTGFHGELTGRENIYMNGAILGMTKKEIDDKIEDIIDFSEVRQFIDTPVKRYSSGMYVKLAFSVAAHLDSEIMIMDEVLAVGDQAFQKKCLDKMNEISVSDGRTILYVSHNMNTIRQLCDRVIVLDHGTKVFDGGVEEGIGVYLDTSKGAEDVSFDYSDADRLSKICGKQIFLQSLHLLNKERPIYDRKEKLSFSIKYHAAEDVDGLMFCFKLLNASGESVGLAQTLHSFADAKKDRDYEFCFSFDISNLSVGKYSFQPDIFWQDVNRNRRILDHPLRSVVFEVTDHEPEGIRWKCEYGNIRLNMIECL